MVAPETKGSVFLNPWLAPDEIITILTGPGEIDMVRENINIANIKLIFSPSAYKRTMIYGDFITRLHSSAHYSLQKKPARLSGFPLKVYLIFPADTVNNPRSRHVPAVLKNLFYVGFNRL
jgi:hypothetical protein